MGRMQLVSHVVQKHFAGEQETHWDKTNQELASSKMVIFFVCLVPVRFLLTSKVFLYHVTDQLQRAHSRLLEQTVVKLLKIFGKVNILLSKTNTSSNAASVPEATTYKKRHPFT